MISIDDAIASYEFCLNDIDWATTSTVNAWFCAWLDEQEVVPDVTVLNALLDSVWERERKRCEEYEALNKYETTK